MWSFQLDQVEDTQEHPLVVPPIPDQIEAGDAVWAAGDCFAVDDACPRPEPRHRLGDAREAPNQVRLYSRPGNDLT
jgi:hypothetical protein